VQVTASVLRNLSWHSDLASRRALSDVAAATALMTAAMSAGRRESTLKSVLSALWNVSSHGADNRADICRVPRALRFLVALLSYRGPSRTLAVVENAGGVLRNVSSHVAVRADYRAVLRRAGCLPTLLRHLRSPSLTVVSNACGTLWNLSARCADDQATLLQLGAVSMLKNLVHSRHRMISMGSAAALKNLLTAAASLPLPPDHSLVLDAAASNSLSTQPGLHIRRQRALDDELSRRQLAETCADMDSPAASPTGASSTGGSPVDARSSSFAAETSRHGARVQSASPLRLSDRSSLLARRASSHAGVPASRSSDEISNVHRRRMVADVGRCWAREPASDSADSAAAAAGGGSGGVGSTMMTSSCCHQSSLSSPSSIHSPPSPPRLAASRRFLKSRNSSGTPSSSSAMCASFLSERSENVHLDDFELKSSCDLDTCARSRSQAAFVDSVSDAQRSNCRLSVDVRPPRPAEFSLSLNDETTFTPSACYVADADREDKSSSSADELGIRKRDVVMPVPVTCSETVRRLDALMQLLPQVDCTLPNADEDVISSEHCEQSETPRGAATAADSADLQHVASSHPRNDDANISTHSDAVSDIMDESFPNLTLSTNSDLQSSTDVWTGEQAAGATSVCFDSASAETMKTGGVAACEAAGRDDDVVDVLCANSADLVSLLEENAQRVVRELQLNTTTPDGASSCGDVRLLEDETISLVSGHNDNDFDLDRDLDNDDDDDDDDDYMDAISSRTYDISSASGGDAACSRHSSLSGGGTDTSRSASPVKTPGRPRIVKPGDDTPRSRQNDDAAAEGKGVRGRRRALYSVTRPRIPPASQTTTLASSGAKPAVERAVVRRPGSAGASSSSRPAAAVSKTASAVSNRSAAAAAAQNVSRRGASTSSVTAHTTASRVRQAGATKKPPATTTTQPSSVMDSTKQQQQQQRRGSATEQVRAASAAASSPRHAASSPSRASSSSHAPAAAKNERRTPPAKQATLVKADQSAEETSVSNSTVDETATLATDKSSSTATERPGSSRDRSRTSSAGSIRSNKQPTVCSPARAPASTGAGRFAAAASKVVGVRHSSPSSARSEACRARTPQSSVPAAASKSAAASVGAGMRSVSAAGARKQSLAASRSSSVDKKPPAESAASSGSAMTRTSTYDKLDDSATSAPPGSITATSCESASPLNNEPAAAAPDSKAADDAVQLSEAVIRRARRLVQQADQIQTRRVSPPRSIRLSTAGLPVSDDVIRRPCERELNRAPPHVTDVDHAAPTDARLQTHAAAAATQPPPPPSTADKPKPSPVRKFGFMGLWRRGARTEAAASTSGGETGTSARRRGFSWWRRTASERSSGVGGGKTAGSDTAERGTSSVGRAATSVRSRSPCRAAVVAPFSYRPSTAPSPATFAALPESHQTKTAMLIERRLRRLKMASESSPEQTAKKPTDDVASARRQRNTSLLVTTV